MPFLPQRMMLTANDIAQLTEEYKYLHQHPELSNQEHETARYIEERFNELQLARGMKREVIRVGETGVVLVLTYGKGPTVAFRADIDGLPLEEKSGLSYASHAVGTLDGREVPVMHGSGHDVHIVSALWAAQILARAKHLWRGTAIFIMQPAGETANGADGLVDAGLWENVPKPEIIYGQHVLPEKSGTFMVSAGETLAAADFLKVTVYGGDGAQQKKTVDPIALGAAMITRLQTIVSHELSPLESAKLTVESFCGGQKANILSGTAEFTLNVRTFNGDVRKTVLDAIDRVVKGEAQIAGAPVPRIEYIGSCPATVNDPKKTVALQKKFIEQFGEEQVITDESFKLMDSEDFSILATSIGVPYVYWGLGGYSARKFASNSPVYGNRSPHFAPDPQATLESGVYAALTAMGSQLLNISPKSFKEFLGFTNP